MKCQWCLKVDAEKTIGELNVCSKCYKDVEAYHKCTICGCKVDSDLARFRRKRFETGSCLSPACSRKEMIGKKACCGQAKVRNCNCSISLECPTHGIRCFGTHN